LYLYNDTLSSVMVCFWGEYRLVSHALSRLVCHTAVMMLFYPGA